MAGVPEDPVDGGDGGDGGGVADAVGQQLLADLPGEHRGVLRLQPDDALHHARRRHLLALEQRLRFLYILLLPFYAFYSKIAFRCFNIQFTLLLFGRLSSFDSHYSVLGNLSHVFLIIFPNKYILCPIA